MKAGHDAATAYRELLLGVLKAVQGQVGARQMFPELGRAVAQAAADIVAAAESLKGTICWKYYSLVVWIYLTLYCQ